MSYRCCTMIQNFALNFNGRIDTGSPCLTLCCEGLPDMPRIPFSKTAEDTLRTFVGEGLLTAVECARVTDDSQRRFTAGCARCAQFQEGDWTINALISYVNLSMYPSPCQSRCIYCGVHQEDQSVTGEAARRRGGAMKSSLNCWNWRSGVESCLPTPFGRYPAARSPSIPIVTGS